MLMIYLWQTGMPLPEIEVSHLIHHSRRLKSCQRSIKKTEENSTSYPEEDDKEPDFLCLSRILPTCLEKGRYNAPLNGKPIKTNKINQLNLQFDLWSKID